MLKITHPRLANYIIVESIFLQQGHFIQAMHHSTEYKHSHGQESKQLLLLDGYVCCHSHVKQRLLLYMARG